MEKSDGIMSKVQFEEYLHFMRIWKTFLLPTHKELGNFCGTIKQVNDKLLGAYPKVPAVVSDFNINYRQKNIKMLAWPVISQKNERLLNHIL